MWEEYNPNPVGRRVGDCAVRAVAKALDTDWETAFIMLASTAFALCDMPSSDSVWGATLRQNGFIRESVPNTCPDCYTLEDFANDHSDGVFVVGVGGHVVTIKHGTLFDSWDSSQLSPQFYWYRKE